MAVFEPKWRNWQTRTFEGRVEQSVGVRVPPSAPFIGGGLHRTLSFRGKGMKRLVAAAGLTVTLLTPRIGDAQPPVATFAPAVLYGQGNAMPFVGFSGPLPDPHGELPSYVPSDPGIFVVILFRASGRTFPVRAHRSGFLGMARMLFETIDCSRRGYIDGAPSDMFTRVAVRSNTLVFVPDPAQSAVQITVRSFTEGADCVTGFDPVRRLASPQKLFIDLADTYVPPFSLRPPP
jgi:hypothetical protein